MSRSAPQTRSWKKKLPASGEWLDVEASQVLRTLNFSGDNEEATTPGMLTPLRPPVRQIVSRTPEIVDVLWTPPPLNIKRQRPAPIEKRRVIPARPMDITDEVDVSPSWAGKALADTKELNSVASDTRLIAHGARRKKRGVLRRVFALSIVLASLSVSADDLELVRAMIGTARSRVQSTVIDLETFLGTSG